MNTIWVAIVVLSILGLTFGIILGYSSKCFEVKDDPFVEIVNKLLPQSQCGQCSYPGCRPYAEAISIRGEKINRCTPGGEATMLKIASLLNVDPQPINDDKEVEVKEALIRTIAVIDEFNCIGCTKCIQVCPVDAIVGATRCIHTVITDLCTGCNLCVAPCPTRCIELHSIRMIPDSWQSDLKTIPINIIPMEKYA